MVLIVPFVDQQNTISGQTFAPRTRRIGHFAPADDMVAIFYYMPRAIEKTNTTSYEIHNTETMSRHELEPSSTIETGGLPTSPEIASYRLTPRSLTNEGIPRIQRTDFQEPPKPQNPPKLLSRTR